MKTIPKDKKNIPLFLACVHIASGPCSGCPLVNLGCHEWTAGNERCYIALYNYYISKAEEVAK